MPEYSRREILRSAAGTLAGTGLSQTLSAADTQPAAGSPPITVRTLFTWDHSTEWTLNRAGAQTIGASNPYARSADVFLEDYTRLLKWCGRHHIDAIYIWGLLRDAHGGIDAAKKLCDIAARENVRLLAGVGLNAYGGVYYDGDSPWSLQRHLEKHPDLYGLDAAGKRMIYHFGTSGPRETHHACPSRKENQDFAAESLAWLMKTLPLGGVQMETGDTGVCRCKTCTERRRHPTGSLSWEDMALMYPLAAKAIRSVTPDRWIICETYCHPEPLDGPPGHPGGFGEGRPAWADACLEKFPDNVFVQWVCDDYVQPKNKRKWTAAGRVQDGRHRHIMRAHFGTYWADRRGQPMIDPIADMVRQSTAHGFHGLSLFGEVSPFEVGAELNYLAFENFGSAANPNADVDIFVREVAAPLLGGATPAHDFLRYAALCNDLPRIPPALPELYQRCAAYPPDIARRWAWLANRLASLATG
jgi:hypothetical protein